MRTRRSWRNQDRLWKLLGGDPLLPPPQDASTVESLERQLAAAPTEKVRRQIRRDLESAKRRRARVRE